MIVRIATNQMATLLGILRFEHISPPLEGLSYGLRMMANLTVPSSVSKILASAKIVDYLYSSYTY